MAFKMKPSPIQLRKIRERILNKNKAEQEQPKIPTIEEAEQYEFRKQMFEDYNPKTDTIFADTSQDMNIAGRKAQYQADRAKAKFQGKTTEKDGMTRNTYSGPGARMKDQKFAYAKSPSGQKVFTAYRLYSKEGIKGKK